MVQGIAVIAPLLVGGDRRGRHRPERSYSQEFARCRRRSGRPARV